MLTKKLKAALVAVIAIPSAAFAIPPQFQADHGMTGYSILSSCPSAMGQAAILRQGFLRLDCLG